MHLFRSFKCPLFGLYFINTPRHNKKFIPRELFFFIDQTKYEHRKINQIRYMHKELISVRFDIFHQIQHESIQKWPTKPSHHHDIGYDKPYMSHSLILVSSNQINKNKCTSKISTSIEQPSVDPMGHTPTPFLMSRAHGQLYDCGTKN